MYMTCMHWSDRPGENLDQCLAYHPLNFIYPYECDFNQFLLMPKFSYEVAFSVFLLQTPSTRYAHLLILLSNFPQIYISSLVLYLFFFLLFILPVTWVRFKLSLKLKTGNPCDNTIGNIPSHSSHTMVWFLHLSFCLINEK